MRAPRRLLITFAALVVVGAACAAEPVAAPSPPPSAPAPGAAQTTASTTTTLAPIPPMEITGVPSDLALMIESVYEHAAGFGESPVESRYLPQRGVAEGMAGRSGTGGVAHLAGSQIALVATGPDLLAAVDDGDGWHLVAVDLPSLGHRDLGYSSAVIAVVGSDARPGEDPTRARADSLHLVGFDGVAGTLDIVGIPRDSWVSIPGGTVGKINSALATGGPERMMATLEALCGYPLDGMLLTGFEGFQEALGNVLGGVQITLDAPMVDPASGANFAAGEQYMNGPQALAFARTRKILPLGDLDRQRNGGLVLVAAATTARFRPVADAAQMLAAASEWAWSDLSAELVLRLAVTSLVAPVLDIGNVVVPGVPDERGGASVIMLSPRAADLLADLSDGSLEP